ncbi:MAG: hypothetical protein M1132_03310 [Chloroflexi bacterium]|nr:hypothetical protein [Chloroflexota bacterium]
MGEIWDRLDGEPLAAFNKFVVYRSLGPGRSLGKAAALYGRSSSRSNRAKLRRPSGRWSTLSVRWAWVSRAQAYDCWVVLSNSDKAILGFYEGVTVAIEKSVRELKETNPKGWKQASQTLATFASFISNGSAKVIGEAAVQLQQLVQEQLHLPPAPQRLLLSSTTSTSSEDAGDGADAYEDRDIE